MIYQHQQTILAQRSLTFQQEYTYTQTQFQTSYPIHFAETQWYHFLQGLLCKLCCSAEQFGINDNVAITTWRLLPIFNSIQKLCLKIVTQLDYNLSSLGPSKHVNKYNNYSYIYTKQHRFIGQSQANTIYPFIQNISINTHT